MWNIAIQSAVGCYNSWVNLRCSGCYPLGEKLLWNRSILPVSMLTFCHFGPYFGRDFELNSSTFNQEYAFQDVVSKMSPILFGPQCVNILRPRQNGHRFAYDTFNKLSWMKMLEFWLRFHWSLFLRVQLIIIRIGSDNGLALFRRQAIIWTNDSLLMHICVSQPQWVKPMARWIMAMFVTDLQVKLMNHINESHYLNLCWLTIKWIWWHSPESIFQECS